MCVCVCVTDRLPCIMFCYKATDLREFGMNRLQLQCMLPALHFTAQHFPK